VYQYQFHQRQELFESLSVEQTKRALLPTAPIQTQIELRGDSANYPGIPVREFTSKSKQKAEAVIRDILHVYHADDVAYAWKCLEGIGSRGCSARLATSIRPYRECRRKNGTKRTIPVKDFKKGSSSNRLTTVVNNITGAPTSHEPIAPSVSIYHIRANRAARKTPLRKRVITVPRGINSKHFLRPLVFIIFPA